MGTRIVNIFHETDPLATRLEPLFFQQEQGVKTHAQKPLKMKNYESSRNSVLHSISSSSPKKKPHNKRIDIMFCPKDRLSKANISIGLLPFYLHGALWESDEVIKFIFQNLLEIDQKPPEPEKH